MRRLPVPLNDAYGSTRLDADMQQRKDMYPHSRGGYRTFPGAAEEADFSTALTRRGAIPDGPAGKIYAVMGSTLYSVDSSYTVATITGTITATTVVDMATDGNQLVIVAGANKYVYTVSGGLVTLSDADLDDCRSVTYLDSRFWFEQPDGQFCCSEVNDATAIDSLDFATAEAQPGDSLAIRASGQLLYVFCERHTEVWQSTGRGRPPVDRQFVLQHGVVARNALSELDGVIYFIDHELRPCIVSGGTVQVIPLPVAIARQWNAHAQGLASDWGIIVDAYLFDRELFVDFRFSTLGIWTYHAPSGTWFEQSDIDTGARAFSAFGDGKTYMVTEGKLFSLDETVITHYGDPSAKDFVLTLPMISGEMFGAFGANVSVGALRANVAADGNTSTLKLNQSTNFTSFSGVGGASGSNSKPFPYAASGAVNGEVNWNGLGRFRDVVYQLDLSFASPGSVLDVAVEVEPLVAD